MSIPDQLRNLLLHLLWPTSCPICGAIGVPACPECLLPLLNPPIPVPLCADSFVLWTGGLHEGVPRELVLKVKYGRNRPLGVVMGQTLGRVFPPPRADLLIPVPLHPDSPRDYNQSAALAQGLGKEWGIPVSELLLWREKRTPQTHLEDGERRNMPGDALILRNKKADMAGQRVILVDDVCTTGTTLRRARSALVAAGATCEVAVTWTYALKTRGK